MRYRCLIPIACAIFLYCFSTTTYWLFAQCSAPSALWLNSNQTSTTLTFSWSAVNGVAQYQLRYFETANPADKTLVNTGLPPFTLSGLRKYTQYTIEIRSKCNSGYSVWSSPVSYLTAANNSAVCDMPTGLHLLAQDQAIQVSWNAVGSHTVSYRKDNAGDWQVPDGALDVQQSPFSIPNLTEGNYQVRLKKNCANTAGNYTQLSVDIGSGPSDPVCPSPAPPIVIPGISGVSVGLPNINPINAYLVQYRVSGAANWIDAGVHTPPTFELQNVLTPLTTYDIRIQAVCPFGTSAFSEVMVFSTHGFSNTCLSNKNFGKNISIAEAQMVDSAYNRPSPFTFNSMIGVNDGGLVFRSFQSVLANPIRELTNNLRIFHTMDEDFDNSLTSYAENTKPRQTTPEGTPAFMGYNKSLYSTYVNKHGFTNILSSTEILQYSPQSWKEKIYQESDWSASGPSGIRHSYGNYTRKFISEFAPATGIGQLSAGYQVGNELWDYPVKADYHSLLLGAWDAFKEKYGPKSAGGWKMKLSAGAFQAFRDNNCTEQLRNASNCGGALERHDFIGDYLNVPECDLLKDLDGIDCHPYSFKHGTLTWTYPEAPDSELGQIRNMAGWLLVNTDKASGILAQTHLWSSEFGYDSNPVTGVGEKTQSAYLIRGLMMHSRFHYEKVYFYNAFDVVKTNSVYYNGLYNSSGFWKQGSHPQYPSQPSPHPAHGAAPKPSWFAMLDFKARFGDHVFYRALAEDQDAYVYLMAKPDGTEPYLVFWSPKMTNDANIAEVLTINKEINWYELLPAAYQVEDGPAHFFAESTDTAATFNAIKHKGCGNLRLTGITRQPVYLKLVACNVPECDNATDPGSILAPVPDSGQMPFNPGQIASTAVATGGDGDPVVYQWQQAGSDLVFADIPGATAERYDPSDISGTVWFRRGAKRPECTDFIYTTAVAVSGLTIICPELLDFSVDQHSNPGCSGSDNAYILKVKGVTQEEEIILEGLPEGGLNIAMSSLNNAPFSAFSFYNNVQLIGDGAYRWLVKPSALPEQTLKLTYCWAVDYPIFTTAYSPCSGALLSCGAGAQRPADERSAGRNPLPYRPEFEIEVLPNPGSAYCNIIYKGGPATHALLTVVTPLGQIMHTYSIHEALENGDQWSVDTSEWPAGTYYIQWQTGVGVQSKIWQKQ